MRILVYSLCILAVLSADGTVKATMTTCMTCVKKRCKSALKPHSCADNKISQLIVNEHTVDQVWGAIAKTLPEMEDAPNYDACLAIVFEVGVDFIELRGCTTKKLQNQQATCKHIKAMVDQVVYCSICDTANCNVAPVVLPEDPPETAKGNATATAIPIRHPPLNILYYIISTVVSLKLLF